MKVNIVTLFPEMVDNSLSASIIGRARKEGIIRVGFVNPRDFTDDKHRTVDNRPYGGGAGMIMMAEPIYKAVESVREKNSYVIVLSPHGKKFDQNTAEKLAEKKHLVLICGHYEGIDARISAQADMEISIGDYILTGGELACAVMVDCITRLLPGVFSKEEVPYFDSFSGDGLLEAPQYTRPSVWRGKKVPEVLLGGNHKEIEKWRKSESVSITKKRRPDLLKAMEEK